MALGLVAELQQLLDGLRRNVCGDLRTLRTNRRAVRAARSQSTREGEPLT